jgi:hypothetical protein
VFGGQNVAPRSRILSHHQQLFSKYGINHRVMSFCNNQVVFFVVACAVVWLFIRHRRCHHKHKPISTIIGPVSNVRIVFASYDDDPSVPPAFMFRWDAPKTSNGEAAYDYTITTPSGSVFDGYESVNAMATLPQEPGFPLAEGKYTITVWPKDSKGRGPSVTVSDSIKVIPGPARNISLVQVPTTKTFYFKWDAADHGQDVTAAVNYRAQIVDPNGKSTISLTGDLRIDLPTPVIRGIYKISVMAYNQYGSGPTVTFQDGIKSV